MTQVLPNPSEAMTNYLDQISEVNKMKTLSEVSASVWGVWKVWYSNDSSVATSF